VIQTKISRHFNPVVRFLYPAVALLIPDHKTIAQGAATQVFAVLHADASAPLTHYLVDCHQEKIHKACSDELAQKLWEESVKIASKF
jgi:hypothetical protein